MNRSTERAALLAGVGEDEIEEQEIEIPEVEDPIVLGRALRVLYEGTDGVIYEHEFRNAEAIVVVDDGILMVLDKTLTLTDLGIED